jgi:hypothetical protein
MKDKKSRNEKIGGMTPSEQVLFNSNREKSPVGTDTSAESIQKKPVTKISSQKLAPSNTGETGTTG